MDGLIDSNVGRDRQNQQREREREIFAASLNESLHRMMISKSNLKVNRDWLYRDLSLYSSIRIKSSSFTAEWVDKQEQKLFVFFPRKEISNFVFVLFHLTAEHARTIRGQRSGQRGGGH